MIKLAKQHQLATTGHQATLHNEDPMVPVWADEVTGVEVYKDMFKAEVSHGAPKEWQDNPGEMPRALAIQ